MQDVKSATSNSLSVSDEEECYPVLLVRNDACNDEDYCDADDESSLNFGKEHKLNDLTGPIDCSKDLMETYVPQMPCKSCDDSSELKLNLESSRDDESSFHLELSDCDVETDESLRDEKDVSPFHSPLLQSSPAKIHTRKTVKVILFHVN